MTHEIQMGDDGIIRIAFGGEVTQEQVKAHHQELAPFLDGATKTVPLHAIIRLAPVTKFSSEARRMFPEMNSDSRIGHIAVLGANRFYQVLGSFIMKVTGRDNIRFFASEAKALSWLKKDG